jgi:hypothetical protein
MKITNIIYFQSYLERFLDELKKINASLSSPGLYKEIQQQDTAETGKGDQGFHNGPGS